MTFLLLLALAAAPQQAETKVRESIGALEKALTTKDESLGDLFDVSRLVQEMERRGAISDGGGYRSIRRLEDNLATIASAPGALNGGWKRMEPLTVRISPRGDEAEALCRVTIGDTKGKFRVWLTRVGDAWRTYDLENLDGTYRLSVIGLQYTPGVHDDEERYSLRDGVMTLQRGAVYLAQGQPAATREAMTMARRSTPPPYVMDWIDLVDGQALNAMGDPAAGLKAADRVLVRQKDLAVAYRLKASCHAALGDPAKAIAAGGEYLRLVGDDAEMWTLVGRAYERLDRKDEAIEAYRKGAEADAEDSGSRLELGRILLERRRTADAVPWLTAAVKLAPAEDDAFEIAADLLDAAGAHGEALALADEADLRRPDDPAVLFRRGRALRTVGRAKEAETFLRLSAKAHPSDRDLPQELVLALAQSGKDAEARELMRTAASWNTGRHAYVRAFVHAAAGRAGPALEELKAVLRIEGELGTTLAGIEKEAAFEKLRGEKEVDALLQAARATREYWRARENPNLAPEELLRIAAERIQAAPDHAAAYFDQARALRRLRRFSDAEPSVRTAIEKSRDKSAYADELGRTLAAEGKLEEALAVADELIRTRPNEEFGLDLRVAVYAIGGKKEAALKALQALLEKHPSWSAVAVPGDELEEFRKLASVQELLRKARTKAAKN